MNPIEMSKIFFTPLQFSDRLPEFNPVVPLRPGTSSESVVVCIPGAGAGVTAFIHLLDALPTEYAVLGLQPRGLGSEHTPDVSIQAAAKFNIRALGTVAKGRSIHLLGHSYGGLVAFEMAQQCLTKELHIESLTVVDSRAPNTSQVTLTKKTDTELRSAFITAIEENIGVGLNINPRHVTQLTTKAFIHAVHTAMVSVGQMSARSHPDTMIGSFQTFAAAIRADYVVATRYPGKVHLITASDPLGHDATHAKRVAGWRSVAAEVDVWKGHGNHFTILRPPYVHALAQHWTSWVNGEYTNLGE